EPGALLVHPVHYVHNPIAQNLRNGPHCYAEAACAESASWVNFTETILETPGSCMVTPYITGATLMVFLLCVMMMNWVCTAISRINSVNRPILASSRGASTSSRIQNGLGWYWKMPTSSASAVSAFSPQECSSTFWSFLPGGDATTSMPLSAVLNSSVRRMK